METREDPPIAAATAVTTAAGARSPADRREAKVSAASDESRCWGDCSTSSRVVPMVGSDEAVREVEVDGSGQSAATTWAPAPVVPARVPRHKRARLFTAPAQTRHASSCPQHFVTKATSSAMTLGKPQAILHRGVNKGFHAVIERMIPMVVELGFQWRGRD